ncbi:hypothetical protein INR49_017112 [Caranx melampygus]|nr:hypothetical protein INR49_017112 [Caranx melampygus]
MKMHCSVGGGMSIGRVQDLPERNTAEDEGLIKQQSFWRGALGERKERDRGTERMVADLDPPLICQAFSQTGPVIQRADSLLQLLILKGQAASLLSLFQLRSSECGRKTKQLGSQTSDSPGAASKFKPVTSSFCRAEVCWFLTSDAEDGGAFSPSQGVLCSDGVVSHVLGAHTED